MALKSRNKVSVEFSMSSMSDMVFLLLIFFMITSTLIHPNALKLVLPRSTNQTHAKKPVTSVSITADLRFAIENNFVQFPELEGRLVEKVGEVVNPEDAPTIALHVDQTVPIEEVVKVMNIAKRHNYRLILATQPE